MINQLIERRKVLLERESNIINRRQEIFKLEDPTVVTDELKRLNVQAKELYNDWWNFQQEVMSLPKWMKLLFNIRKDL